MPFPNWNTIAAIGVLAATTPAQDEVVKDVDWLTDLPAAEVLAAKNKKPLLLVFR